MSEEKTLAIIEPQMEVASFGAQKTNILDLIKSQMKLNQDFGIIPGTKNKTLYQPGAEKLAKFFGLAPRFKLTKEVENIEKNFVYYRYRCVLVHIATGTKVGEAERSCNSGEASRRGKSIYDLVNTCQAMAQKRALVAAVRTATMASDIFKDDIEENGNTGPTTKAVDPQRTNLIAKLHVVAGARGFNEENLHEVIEKMYGVSSVTNLINGQIYSLTEKMLANFKEVPKGSVPERIEVKEEVLELPENTECKNDKCTKGEDGGRALITKESYNEYFCTEECRDIYWEKADKVKKSKEKMDNFIKKVKK